MSMTAMASPEVCRAIESANDHQSESDGLSSDIGGFLSTSCMENDDKGDPADPFSTDNTLSFSGDSSRFDSDCILTSSLAEGVSVQTSTCDATGSAYSIAGDAESLSSTLHGGALLLSDTPGTSEQKQSDQMAPSNILLANTADSKHYVNADNQKLEFLSPLLLTPVSQSHPVVIGNSSAASFVKTVLQGTSLQSASSSSTSTPSPMNTFLSSKEPVNLPPGIVLLNPTVLPQINLLPSASGISSPLVIQLPAATGLDAGQLSALGLNVLTSLPVSSTDPGAVGTYSNIDSYIPSAISGNASSVLGPASATPFVSYVSLASAATLTTTQSSLSDSATALSSSDHRGVEPQSVTGNSDSGIPVVTVNTPVPTTSLSSTSSSSSQSDCKTSKNPLVISCTPPNAAVSKGLQQILDHYLQQNKKVPEKNIEKRTTRSMKKRIAKEARGESMPTGTESGTSSADSKPQLVSVKELEGDVEVSTFTVPGLGEKSNSVVVVLRRTGSQTGGSSLVNNSSSSTSSASGIATNFTTVQSVAASTVSSTPAETGKRNRLPHTDTITNIPEGQEEDEIDGASNAVNTLAPSKGRLVSATPVSANNQTASAEANLVNEKVQGDNLMAHANAVESASLNSDALPNDAEWVQVKLLDTNSAKVEKGQKANDDIQKFIPLTVNEKLVSDACRPIIICIVQEDGVKRQVNINPVEMVVTDVQQTGDAANTSSSPDEEDMNDTQLAVTSCNNFQEDQLSLAKQEEPEAEEQMECEDNATPAKTASGSTKAKKQIQCDLCTAVFTRHGNFLRHRKVHTVNLKEDKRFKCPYCDRPFLQRCDMRRHMAIHTNEHPFHCQTCGKGYIRKSDLVVHERFHSKEKAFRCEICERCFYQSGDLRRHRRLVHSQCVKVQLYSCAHCNRKYTREVTLIRHMKTAHNDILLQYVRTSEPVETD